MARQTALKAEPQAAARQAALKADQEAAAPQPEPERRRKAAWEKEQHGTAKAGPKPPRTAEPEMLPAALKAEPQAVARQADPKADREAAARQPDPEPERRRRPAWEREQHGTAGPKPARTAEPETLQRAAPKADRKSRKRREAERAAARLEAGGQSGPAGL